MWIFGQEGGFSHRVLCPENEEIRFSKCERVIMKLYHLQNVLKKARFRVFHVQWLRRKIKLFPTQTRESFRIPLSHTNKIKKFKKYSLNLRISETQTLAAWMK